uniref:Uncharacterized protein n=1 Tax=Nelumbo nucifera TaxID=4432 RepID=A0A822XQ79_NELNU|nr:TPA_asm: hypothetical protein HUJ06_022712 [Nelumbo nucifera]
MELLYMEEDVGFEITMNLGPTFCIIIIIKQKSFLYQLKGIVRNFATLSCLMVGWRKVLVYCCKGINSFESCASCLVKTFFYVKRRWKKQSKPQQKHRPN